MAFFGQVVLTVFKFSPAAHTLGDFFELVVPKAASLDSLRDRKTATLSHFGRLLTLFLNSASLVFQCLRSTMRSWMTRLTSHWAARRTL